jgi:RHS repeat-associated protein
MVEQQNGSSYTEILYGPAGKLALMSGQTVSKAFIPLPAGATAVYTAGPTLSYFRHPDWLGSSRFASTASRTMYYSGAYAPFGEAYAEAGTSDRSFTGQNQDTVSGSTAGLYDFLYREYAQYGRWISPDPAGIGAADPSNPQSWNRYAYVLNNPLTLLDPLGLATCEEQGLSPDYCVDVEAKDPWAEYPQDKPPSETGGVWEIPYDPLDGLRSLEYHNNFGRQLEIFLQLTIDTKASVAPPANNGKGCNATGAVSFIHAHQADAATIANQLGVPVQNVLGLSGIESQWGTSNAALQANNFFGLHGGANAPFATGVWYTSGGVAMSSFPSYLASGQSFAAQYGSFVRGVTNPTAFAQALVKAGFNPGKLPLGNPNFVRDTAATINATAGRMQCP